MRLSITTPYMHGDNVRKLQTFLKQKGWLQGQVDGVFGPDTARAVYRGKYWLGYPLASLNQVCGDLFYGYVSNSKHPNEAMKARTASRKKAQAGKPLRQKMIEEARKHIGVKESPPNSNRVEFSTWYGLQGPWCAMFVTWCGVHVGSKVFARGDKWAYVPYMVSDARAGRNGLAVTYKPQLGDLVTFDWEHNGVADHVGFFDHWTSVNTFKSVEGNTGIGNDSNGGEVMARDRDKSSVLCFIHVAT